MYFKPTAGADGTSVTMRLSLNDDQYLDFIYTLAPGDYMLRFDVSAKNMDTVLSPGTNSLDMHWVGKIRQQETGRKFEERYTQIYYKFTADDVEKLSESKDDSKSLSGRVQWIAFKDQFFSSVLIANEGFTSVKLDSKMVSDGMYLKIFDSQMAVAFDPTGKEVTGFRFYLGPNHYSILRKYDKGVASDDRQELDKLVPLGSSIFRWVNKWLILPMFNFFGSFIGSYGLIIFLMTLVVKLVLFPLTYKSYMSSAKMRVLRPQVEEISKKYPGQDKAMDRQKATMALYSRAGASPMSGCIPMLLQMPFLIALFMFFPSAIELRQESFLWAKDLSTYDAVYTWNQYIPFITPYFGNHISLFCILMTIVNLIYTKFNADATNTGQQQMPGMKYIMYLMPLMFLVFFNQYASGLTYYYLVSTLLTIIQTLIFRQFVNEEKLLAKLEENKKKPRKRSGFMARLEEAQKKQQEQARQRAKTNAKRR
jgi:YidC/Oxa1 family membrane protein insertase